MSENILLPGQELILASSSPYRKALLQRLNVDFATHSPNIDETLKEGETAHDYVERLSVEKAQVLLSSYPEGVIIGSDQCALLDGKILGKPGDFDHAHAQLTASSGQRVDFLTGLCVIDGKSGRIQSGVEHFSVQFRRLRSDEITRYLEQEEPYNCAGSFKSEGLGVTLFNSMRGDDPTALIGLPLIKLCSYLRALDCALP